jgi:hypothetical protein
MSEGWNNANCGDSSGTKMASVKQEEADGLGPQAAVMKNSNENETSGVNPRLQSWPFSEDIGQPVTTNSGFTQQLSLAGAAGSDQPYLLVNQSDASQGSLAPYLSYESSSLTLSVNCSCNQSYTGFWSLVKLYPYLKSSMCKEKGIVDFESSGSLLSMCP